MSPSANGRQNPNGLSCLVVASDVGLQIALRSVLREIGLFEIIASARGKADALAALEASRFELVFVVNDGAGRNLVDGVLPDWLENRLVLLTGAPLSRSERERLRERGDIRAVLRLPLTSQAVENLLSTDDQGPGDD